MKTLYLFAACLLVSFAAQAQDTTSAPYCRATFSTGNSSGDYLTSIKISTFDPATKNANNPQYLFYKDYPLASLFKTESYPMVLGTGTAGGQTVAAWIDWNHNNTFDSNEKLGETDNVGASATTSFNFTVPNNAATGLTRVRIMTVYDGANLTPCGNYVYGEQTDYTIFVNESPYPYCSPTAQFGSSGKDYLKNITFGSLSYTAAGSDTLGAAYINLMNQPVGMAPGTFKTMYINNTPNYDEYVGVWVDWDNNGAFGPSEKVDTFFVAAGGNDSVSVLVNPNQALGQYRARVRVQYQPPLDPCANSIFSVVYDLQINVGNVSTNEVFADKFSMYPNPVSGSLFVNTKNGLSNTSLISVYDATGRLVHSQKGYASAGSRIELPVDGLAAGIYTLQIVENGKVAASRFVKE